MTKETIKLGTFVNGNEYCQHHFIEAEGVLRRNAVYRSLGNFGPYIEEKQSRLPFVKIIEEIVIGDYMFTIVDAVGISPVAHKTNTQREAWFQRVTNQ
jgi:hypothetical protein